MTTEKIIYLLKSDPDSDWNNEDEWCNDPAPTIDHNPNDAIKYIRDDGEIEALLSIVKDCLSYADAMAILKEGEAVELRDKCRAIIEKIEGNNA